MSRMIWMVRLVLPVAGLLFATGSLAAEDTEEADMLSGTAAIGGSVSHVEGWIGRAAEYGLVREPLESQLDLMVNGRSGFDFMEVRLDHLNEADQSARAYFRSGPWVRAEFDHQLYQRWLDHDRLQNVQFREWVGFDSTGADRGGGKMVTHEDTDPFGRYGFEHSETKSRVDLLVPLPEDTPAVLKMHAALRDQRRIGSRQGLGVDHCANCHVRSHAVAVDELTRDARVGLDGTFPGVAVGYEATIRDFNNLAAAPTNRYMEARHPANGGSAAEFGSRLIYDNEELEFSQTPDSEKIGHALRASADLPHNQSVRGSMAFASMENQVTGLELKSNSSSLGWYAPITKRARVSVNVTRRSIENDPTDIDLPLYRDGRAGGGQDFDWTRLSAYNREEWIGQARAAYALRPGQNLRMDWRMHTTDRDHVELDPDGSDTRTTKNRLRAAWSGRIRGSTRSRVEVEYEKTSLPFVNVGGLCEEEIGGTVESIPGQPNDWIYYFQRERYGTGGNLPTQAVRARAQLNGSVGSRFFGSGYVSVASEKNDDLNAYDFERSVLSPGVSFVLVPSQHAALNGGMAYSRIESNAKICATVMDG
ncbi:MAG: cytochrome c [Gemmatimonadota bacterium]|nr:MAG: cytochrome c [Gemmatimonadota bacterium]